MSSTPDQRKQLQQLHNVIMSKPPYCSGTVPVEKDDLVVYYSKGEDESAHRINLGAASAESLEHLAKTCDVATFGRNDEDVLDESYRKAGKLDSSSFSVKLDLERSGLLDVIRDHLMEERDLQQDVYAELYKLNVYGEGSFFKAHVDTPRATTMFGSLVIIYPTPHEGGSLIFRERAKEWTFDSAQAVKTGSEAGPCVAYATFFSDAEHEVSRVTSGHRVTVTYNLYFADRAGPNDMPTASPDSFSDLHVFRSLLETLLQVGLRTVPLQRSDGRPVSAP
ncbi:hypothetical protein EIP86_010681 [Pleurotus ostreatoroseus]|nr:hypothetical protein EIP86_010681 [Pleurotus ostreatoroseus]